MNYIMQSYFKTNYIPNGRVFLNEKAYSDVHCHWKALVILGWMENTKRFLK